MSRTLRKTSSESRSGVTRSSPRRKAALLIRMSTRPNSASVSATMRSMSSALVTSPTTGSARRPCSRTCSAVLDVAPACRLFVGRKRLGRPPRSGGDDVAAELRQRHGAGPPDAAQPPRAGDDRNLAVELSHVPVLLRSNYFRASHAPGRGIVATGGPSVHRVPERRRFALSPSVLYNARASAS